MKPAPSLGILPSPDASGTASTCRTAPSALGSLRGSAIANHPNREWRSRWKQHQSYDGLHLIHEGGLQIIVPGKKSAERLRRLLHEAAELGGEREPVDSN